MNEILAFYTSHSPITDPGSYANLYMGLPTSVPELIQIIHGQMLHRNTAEATGVPLTRYSRAEKFLRTMQDRLGRIMQLDPAPLTQLRQPREQQIGMCRDFAVFLVSLLRSQGIPARMRVGFADYMQQSPYKSDHWITEYWQPRLNRWVLVDPDIGGLSPGSVPLRENINLLDLKRDRDYYVAGSAWSLCRAGKAKPLLFRYSGRWKGYPCMRGNLLHDFQALNRLELGLFDYWDELSKKPETAMTVEDKALLDRIASLTLDPDANFDELRELFDEMPRTRRLYAVLRQLGVIDDVEMADPHDLQLSGGERLEVIAQNKSEVLEPQTTLVSTRFTQQSDDLPDDHPANLQALTPPGFGDIVVRGARQHNLKNITVNIPRHKLVVITGVSGSGKSSLAFDTIYAEGQRRYVESLSSYARQFMEQMEKPQVDQITGLSPSIAIEQKAITRNPRSTVGTVTEILDYLRVLFARLGVPHCPQCGRTVQPQSAQQIADQLSRLTGGTHFQLLAPVVRNRKGSHVALLKQALADGYPRARIDDRIIDLNEGIPQLDKKKKHEIALLVDRLVVPEIIEVEEDDFKTRLMDSVETALNAAGGMLVVALDDEEITLSEHNACPVCDISFPRLEPHLFSFNSPLGMCDACNGLGIQLQVDPNLIIVNPSASLIDGASAWHGNLRKKSKSSQWHARTLGNLADHYGADMELPWNELPEKFCNAILYGSGDEKIRWTYRSQDGTYRSEGLSEARGVIYHINRFFRQTKSEGSRRYYMQFMSQLPCLRCNGERLNAEARFVTVDGKRLPELTSWSIEAIHEWIGGLAQRLTDEQGEIGQELIQEIHQRLGFLRNVGLHYLNLDRPAPTLSGGEGQRIRLASQIGSGLVGVLYILDEPSIGLHARDHRALLDTLLHLRDIGNTVLVVEHDEATMRTADWILDLGPGPGILGGELVAAGPPDDIMRDTTSLTGRYLSGELTVTAPNGRTRREPKGWLTVHRARLHNLKEIDARFPLRTLICVTGVSGSGKSSLIAQTLHPALARALQGAQGVPGPHDSLKGLGQVDKVIDITQDPIGRNPRSNPGTYAGLLDEIRRVFATTPQAKALGYNPGRFSFNVKGGRCEECKGYGYKKVEMHFLPDVWIKCKACQGMRFNRQTLAITYKGVNIADVLDMDVQQALQFFTHHPKIKRILQNLHDVGLDYIKLGQSALTLSGGEAQRVKLAKELSRIATGRTIYILDEPTTGLHFADIQHLLDVLHRLVNAGNTVIIIEHNLDVIKTADWVIDLGPEGGERGGYIVAEGTPEDIAQVAESYTGRYLLEVLEKNKPQPEHVIDSTGN